MLGQGWRGASTRAGHQQASLKHLGPCRPLQSGRLAGAGLDVTEPEPLDPASPLLGMDQVIVTPHAAWYSEEGRSDLKRRVAEEAVRVLLRGESPLHCVNPEVLRSAGRRPDRI